MAVISPNIRVEDERRLAEEQRRRADAQAEEALRQSQIAQQERDRARDESRRAYRHYYVAQLNLAQRDWEDAQIPNLLGRLEQTRPEHTGDDDLRGFEWHYWARLCHAELSTLTGHTAGVNSVAFSPDGTWLASASKDSTVKVWDAVTGQETLTLKGYYLYGSGAVPSVAFSPDGTRLASVSSARTAKVWDATPLDLASEEQ